MRVLLDAKEVESGLRRIAAELCERQRGTEELVLVGIRRGGMPIAKLLAEYLREVAGREVPVASVDITLYRDDAASALPNPRLGPSDIPMPITGKRVVLVDDVLHTRRTIRAALDAVLDYGRPARIELVALVDRPFAELPIQADYVVKRLDSPLYGEKIDVINQNGELVAWIQSEGAPSIPPPPVSSNQS
jgi:pyrimidine operon attenuation protein / uracil phosphoribosyltransferase